jgi:hypothetical protein
VRVSVSRRPSFFASCTVLWIFLAKAGTQVIVPFRDEDEKRHLKVMGDLGQIVPLVCPVPSPKGLSARPIDVC